MVWDKGKRVIMKWLKFIVNKVRFMIVLQVFKEFVTKFIFHVNEFHNMEM